jgi:hypothetical protein
MRAIEKYGRNIAPSGRTLNAPTILPMKVIERVQVLPYGIT